MPHLFPPGDTSWKNNQPQSAWREFNFVYNQIKRTIEPHLALEDIIEDWNDIAKSLSERPRKRNSQLSNYFLYQ
jgi:hypothetical protein